MGSAADLGYQKYLEDLAYALGQSLAEAGYILVYGAEKDTNSLSSISAKGAKIAGGLTIGVTYGRDSNIWGDMKNYTDIIISAGMERGGGREFVLVSSCDAIITIGGGSGTLNEITIAYQKKIPIICIKGTGGWSDRLADTYIDERYLNDPTRFICKSVMNIKEGLEYLSSLSS